MYRQSMIFSSKCTIKRLAIGLHPNPLARFRGCPPTGWGGTRPLLQTNRHHCAKQNCTKVNVTIFIYFSYGTVPHSKQKTLLWRSLFANMPYLPHFLHKIMRQLFFCGKSNIKTVVNQIFITCTKLADECSRGASQCLRCMYADGQPPHAALYCSTARIRKHRASRQTDARYCVQWCGYGSWDADAPGSAHLLAEIDQSG